MPVQHVHRAVPAFAATAVCLLAAVTAMASDVMGPMPPPAHRQSTPVTMVAPAAGHHHRPRPCPECRGDCRGGACPAQCPVRPDEFGFYETRWRTWPGVATPRPVDIEAVTPASPPRSEVPPVDEESRAMPQSELLPAEAAPLPTPQPVPDRARGREAEPSESAAPAKEPKGEEATEPAPTPRQQPGQPTEKETPTEEENLFDEAMRRLPRAERMALLMGRAARHAAAAAPAAEPVVPVTHTVPVTTDMAPPTLRSGAPGGARDVRSRNPLR